MQPSQPSKEAGACGQRGVAGTELFGLLLPGGRSKAGPRWAGPWWGRPETRWGRRVWMGCGGDAGARQISGWCNRLWLCGGGPATAGCAQPKWDWGRGLRRPEWARCLAFREEKNTELRKEVEAGGLGSSESSGGRAGGVWRPAYLKREGLGDQKRGPEFLDPRSWTGLEVWNPEFSRDKRTGGLGSQKSWRGVELPILEGGRAWRSGFLCSHRTRAEGRTSGSWTSGDQGTDS